MSSREARLLSLFLGLFAFLILLEGCISEEEEIVLLDVQVDSTWTHYDRVLVELADTTGRTLDTLFDNKLISPEQLRNLDGSGYDGGIIQIILHGYYGDISTRNEIRVFDGHLGRSIKTTTTVSTYYEGPDGRLIFDLKPDAAKLFTGGPELTLTLAGKYWVGKTLLWSSTSPFIATVSDGKVKPVAPGKTWIQVMSEQSRDSTEITVITDTPILDPGTDTVALTGATLAFRIGVRQEFGVIDMFKWSLDGDTLWDDSSSTPPLDAGTLTTPSRLYSGVDTVTIRFYVRDGEGNTALATRRLIVTDQNLPVIASFRPGDTTVSIRDSVGFSARVNSKVTLASHSWDFGDDGRAEVSGDLSDTAATLSTGRSYPDTGFFPLLLKVTDTKGGVATRRATVRVTLDLPIADAGRDTAVAAATRINLHGKAADGLGKVVKTEWKIGAAAYVTASPETTFTAPAVGGSVLVCRFRVTDDDGLMDEDTVRITVSASADADLSALIPSAGTLSPAFARATAAYTLIVSNSVTSMTLTPTAASAAATIRVNGVVVAGGSTSGNLALAVGANTLTVAVTAQSGLVKTYTITATREGTTLPDLVITSATITSITATSVNYSYTIRNDGGATIPDLWGVSIQNFYSNDQVFNNTGDAAAGGSILGARRSLAPGESYSGTYQASGAPGAFQYVTWKIDWGEAVAESNENNNTVAMPIR